jgi:hypothetical protein
MSIIYIHFCICTNIDTEIFHEPNTISDFSYHANSLRSYSDSIYEQAMKLARHTQEISSNDHLIMKLLILVMIFSKGADSYEGYLLESTKIFRTQNIFCQLLWNYLNVRFSYHQTASIFSRLIFSCLKAHSIARQSKEIIVRTNIHTDDLAPLMQSVLQIS